MPYPLSLCLHVIERVRIAERCVERICVLLLSDAEGRPGDADQV
jgi:hypothetical protein